MNLFDVLNAFIPLVALIVVYLVKSDNPVLVSKANLELAKEWGTIGIVIAERLLGAKMGKDKKEFVSNFLKSNNVDLTPIQISFLIDGMCDELTAKGIINKNK